MNDIFLVKIWFTKGGVIRIVTVLVVKERTSLDNKYKTNKTKKYLYILKKVDY